MANGGYWGVMLDVDMTAGTVTKTDRHMQYVDEWIGGRSLGMKLLWEDLKDKPGIDPMGPENPNYLIPGPCAGVPLISASRYESICKNTITQAVNSPYGEFGATVGNAAGGGQFGPELKMAGYDLICIKGQSATPKVLYINNDDVQLLDGTKYWGMSTMAFEQAIQEEYGYEFKNTCIGPAGENGVRYSCVMNETGRAAGRGGTGAALGAKKFKGVIVHGDLIVPIANPSGLMDMIDKFDQYSWSHSATPGRRRWGTAASLDNNSDSGRKSVRNHREGTDPNQQAISCVASHSNFWVRHRGCYCCQQRCMKIGVVRSGPYAGTIAEGPEYESAMNTSNWLIDNMEDAGAVMERLDRYGYDLIGVGGTVAFVLEAYENSVITSAMLGGIKAEWGNAAEILKLMDAIIYNHDLEVFEWLRRGSTYAANKLGKDSVRYAMDCKNHSYAAHGTAMGGKSRCIGYGTANRGACHVSGTSASSQDSIVVRDMGVFCSFSSGCFGTAGMAEMLNFIMGLNWTTEQYLFLGEKTFNLEKVFNCVEGFRRVDDALPWRTHNEPLKWGPHAGAIYTLEDYEAALDEYYAERGWDLTTTIPSVGKLQELGLNDLVDVVRNLS